MLELMKEIMVPLLIMLVSLMEINIIEILVIQLLEDPYHFQLGFNLLKREVGKEFLILEMDLLITIYQLQRVELQQQSNFMNTFRIKIIFMNYNQVLILIIGIIGCLLMILNLINKYIEMVNCKVHNYQRSIRWKFLEC